MKEGFESKYHEVEKTHFWFMSRRRYILNLLKDTPKESRILDIGCSSGILLNELADTGFKRENLFGIDISQKAIDNCKDNNIQNSSVMDAQNISFDKKFDIIIASDCLEHLKDDRLALDNWHSLLNENGSLYVFVPAFMVLWSSHDVHNMHFRRYTRKELESKLKASGFEIQKSSYWNFFLFLPIYLIRVFGRLFKTKKENSNGDLQSPPFFNNLLLNLITVENQLLKFINFPFGVSAFCIVKKTHET